MTLAQLNWPDVGPLFHISLGPMLSNHGLPTDTMTLARRLPNVCVLAGRTIPLAPSHQSLGFLLYGGWQGALDFSGLSRYRKIRIEQRKQTYVEHKTSGIGP